MKKFLLVALAAVVAGSASAQLQSKKEAGKPQSNKSVVSHARTAQPVAPLAYPTENAILAPGGHNFGKKLTLSAKELQSIQPVRKAATSSLRKADLQSKYNGYGVDLASSEGVQWTMKTATSTEGEALLVDIVPNPTTLDGLGVTYRQVGNYVLIAPQQVFRTSSYYVFVAGDLTNDGSIMMTLGDDGSLKLGDGEQIVYGAFSTDTFDPNYGDTYLGYYQITTDIKYLREGETLPAPNVAYEPENLYLHASFDNRGYGFINSQAMMPAYTPVTFRNYTLDPADAWSWKFSKLQVNEARDGYEEASAITADTQNLTVTAEDGVYAPPVLTGSMGEEVSTPFQWGLMTVDDETGEPNYTNAYVYAGHIGDNLSFQDDAGNVSGYPLVGLANPDLRIAYHSGLGTPDVNAGGYQFSNLILYQGKPAAPFYFEGVNMLLYQFEAKDGCTLKCKIQKVTRANGRITLGDVIAESDLEVDNIIDGDRYTELVWKDFYVVDEDGMSETVDYLFVEDEFAIVIDGWDNGTFSAIPNVEYLDYGSGSTYTYFTFVQNGSSRITNFVGAYYKTFVGFKGAVHGYLHTEDNTNLTIAAEGGEATIHVQPMLYSTDNATGQPTYRLFVESVTVDGEEAEEIPEWLTFGVANQNYDEGIDYDLVVKADALPAGTEGRTAEVVFYQEGAKLTVKVAQGSVEDGISTVVTKQPAHTGKVYDLSGRPVQKSARGVAVKDGKKFFVK